MGYDVKGVYPCGNSSVGHKIGRQVFLPSLAFIQNKCSSKILFLLHPKPLYEVSNSLRILAYEFFIIL
jgi:hypothetical protein